MTEATKIARRFRISGGLLSAGLLVELFSFLALTEPTGFLAFAIAGGTLAGAGILFYLYSLVA